MAGRLEEADLNLGCGVPTRHAALRAGETVLDLGSGAGNDVFIARHEVGPEGRVLGVDMTPDMIAKARANAAKLGYDNVEFRLGEIEQLPVEAGSVDVVISNCVLNLVPDKARAFAEMARVLRPGGRFCVSDIVATGELPEGVRAAAGLYVGCVAGAIPETDYLALLAKAGFEGVRIVEPKPIELPGRGTRAAHGSGGDRVLPRFGRHPQERDGPRHQAGITFSVAQLPSVRATRPSAWWRRVRHADQISATPSRLLWPQPVPPCPYDGPPAPTGTGPSRTSRTHSNRPGGPQHRSAALAVIEELAGVRGHGLGFSVAAGRAGDGRAQLHQQLSFRP